MIKSTLGKKELISSYTSPLKSITEGSQGLKQGWNLEAELTQGP